MGVKNVSELEGMIDSCKSFFSFLNRSVPFFPKERTEVPPKAQVMMIIETPLVEELSGMAIIKVLDRNEHGTSIMKLKFIRNKAILKVINNTSETMTFDKTSMIGILRLEVFGLLQAHTRCY